MAILPATYAIPGFVPCVHETLPTLQSRAASHHQLVRVYTSSGEAAQGPAAAYIGSPPPLGHASMHGGSSHDPVASLRHLLASSDCESPRVAAVCHASGSATAWAVGALFLILFGGALGAL